MLLNFLPFSDNIGFFNFRKLADMALTGSLPSDIELLSELEVLYVFNLILRIAFYIIMILHLQLICEPKYPGFFFQSVLIVTEINIVFTSLFDSFLGYRFLISLL